MLDLKCNDAARIKRQEEKKEKETNQRKKRRTSRAAVPEADSTGVFDILLTRSVG